MFAVIECGNLIVEPIRKMPAKPKLLFVCLLALTLLPISAYAVIVDLTVAVLDDSTVVNAAGQQAQSELTAASNALVETTLTDDLSGLALTTASDPLVTATDGGNAYLEVVSSAILDTDTSKYSRSYEHHCGGHDLGRPSGARSNSIVQETTTTTIITTPEPTTISLLLLGAGILSRRLRTVR